MHVSDKYREALLLSNMREGIKIWCFNDHLHETNPKRYQTLEQPEPSARILSHTTEQWAVDQAKTPPKR